MNTRPIITLMTDFGNTDGFVGVMKGVIVRLAPAARLIDISHELQPFAIASAAFLNEWSFRYFPEGTVHLCVVDPGVGTKRRPLVAAMDGHYFVAPDNGLLIPALDQAKSARVFAATRKQYWLEPVSNTFHGRDIFSPLAAHLANGVAIEELGEEIHNPVRLPLKPLAVTYDRIECHICHIDRFGNLVTDLDQPTFEAWASRNGVRAEEVLIRFQRHTIRGISQAYGEKKRGEFLAVFDGYGRLEIAATGGHAASITGLGITDTIQVLAGGID